MVANLAFGLRLWWNQFTPAGFLVAAWGLVALWRGERRLALFSLLVVVVDVAFAAHYDIAEDSDAYYLPTFLMTALWIAWGANSGLAWLRGRGESFARDVPHRPPKSPRLRRSVWANASPLLGYAALALLVALNLGLHWRQSDKRDLWLPRDYATQALAELEPNAMFLTRDWQVYAPLLYLQHVEGERPDARIIDVELLRRTWYLDYVAGQYPDLIARCQAELDAYREQLVLFEYDLPYDAAAIQERYIALLNALLREGQPAHVGLDMEQGVGSGYVGVPLGVTVALREDDVFAPFDTTAVRSRGLNDGTIRVDAVVKKIRRSYAAVRAYRGVYLTRHGRAEEALQAWDEAAKLDPEYSLPHRLAGDLYAQTGRIPEARTAYLRALAVNPQDTTAQQGLAAVGGK
jgi:tetratricopeptide (TPR) repeat protein